jgi:hypothetical protein
MARFYFHIRMLEGFDPDYDGVEIRCGDGIAEAVSIARRMVSELLVAANGSYSLVSPLVSKLAAGQTPKKVNADPLCCLQSVRWQMPIRLGEPRTASRTSPHLQDPVSAVISSNP